MRIAMYEARASVRGGLNRIANRPMQIKMEIRSTLPPLRRAMVSILCLRLVFPPTNGKIRRRSSVTEFRSVKKEILLYITTGLKKK